MEQAQLRSWSLRKPNGTSLDVVERCIHGLLMRQHGQEVTLSQVKHHVRNQLSLSVRHTDLRDIMLLLGARLVNSTSQNKYIFDITDCMSYIAPDYRKRNKT